MSIAEEQLDEELPLRNPQRLSAAIHKHGQDRLEDSDIGEDFNFKEIDDGSSSESESDVSVVQPAQQSKVSGNIFHQIWTNQSYLFQGKRVGKPHQETKEKMIMLDDTIQGLIS